MKLTIQSHTSIVTALQQALNKYSFKEGTSVVTDIYLQPNPVSGLLAISNDDEEVLGEVPVSEWVEANPENFYADAEMSLKKVLNQLWVMILITLMVLISLIKTMWFTMLVPN